jgi:hypothetical protein
MKRTLAFALGLLLFAVPVMADTSSEDGTEVWVEVEENVSISARAATVWFSPIQTGVIEGTVEWDVMSNVQELKFWGVATDFYKSCDATNPDAPPIPLVFDDPAYKMWFVLAEGHSIDPADGRLEYIGPQNVGDFAGHVTAQGLFGSSQLPSHFDQILTQTAYWMQGLDTQPAGYYCAKVETYAMLP